MKLLKLDIENFKAIERLTIAPNGENIIIRGKNGTGKTTVADAYTWLFTGKFSDGTAAYERVKRYGAKGELPTDSGQPHAVTATLRLDDGKEIKLRREFVERWETERGSTTGKPQMVGHTTKYYINDVPVATEKDWSRRLGEIVPEGVFASLTQPAAFYSLPWKKRRQLLMDICGDVSDADVIASDTALKEMETLLIGRSVDEYRKLLDIQKKSISARLKEIPARIDELRRNLKDGGGAKGEMLATEIKCLEQERETKIANMNRLEMGADSAELQKKLAAIEAAIVKYVSTHEAERAKEKSRCESTIESHQIEINRLNREIMASLCDQEKLLAKAKKADDEAESLRLAWNKKDREQPNITINDKCPYCGQPIPKDKLQEILEKAKADFNAKKRAELDAITAKGKAVMAERADTVAAIKRINTQNAAKEEQVTKLEAERDSAKARLGECEALDITKCDEYQNLCREKADTEAKINSAGDAGESEHEKLRQEIAAMGKAIEEKNGQLAAARAAAEAEARINELVDEEKKLDAEYAEVCRRLKLTDEFIRRKVDMTEAAINKRFQIVRWKLFDQQLNGSLKECCEPLVGGVPYEQLNTGGKLTAALDILNTLTAHHGVILPVIIDNAESYGEETFIHTENQQIRLVFDETCETLTCDEIVFAAIHEPAEPIKAEPPKPAKAEPHLPDGYTQETLSVGPGF